MSVEQSSALEIGIKLPEFELINTLNNKQFSSNPSGDKGKLIMFICNHCPYVVHYHNQITQISNQYENKIDLIAISANDANSYPEDSPEKMKELAEKLNWNFPYLYDETQDVAKKYNATCTPDFYLLDKDNALIYHGRMDDSNPSNNKEPTGQDLTDAIDGFLSNKQPVIKQHQSIGCSIKWKHNS